MDQILSSITQKYQADSNTLGLMVFGSYARGQGDHFSDIDLYILAKKRPGYERHNYLLNGKQIDVIIDSISEAKEILTKETVCLRRNFTHMLATGQIIFDKTGDLLTLKKTAVQNNKKQTKKSPKQIRMYQYSIDDFFTNAKRASLAGDAVTFNLEASLLINSIIEFVVFSQGEYLRQPSEIESQLKKIDPGLLRLLLAYYKTGDIRALQSLVNYTDRKYGKLPKNWQT